MSVAKTLLSVSKFHSSWEEILLTGLTTLPQEYLKNLLSQQNWLPGVNNIFNAFTLPLPQTEIILLGESPYPRPASANGFAFWDAAVDQLWTNKGLAKPVNRATSLRNLIKMLLCARGDLTCDGTSQSAIAALNKDKLVKTNQEFFTNFLTNGFLLLNASLVLSDLAVKQEAKIWQSFLQNILKQLLATKPNLKLLLLGTIANTVNAMDLPKNTIKICAEHPYNLSFIHNKEIINFFAPLDMLLKK